MRELISSLHLYWGYLLPSQLLYPLNLTIAAVLWRFVVSCPLSNILIQLRSFLSNPSPANLAPNHSYSPANLPPNHNHSPANLPPNYCLLAFFAFLASSSCFLLLSALRHWRGNRSPASVPTANPRHASDLMHPLQTNDYYGDGDDGDGVDLGSPAHGQIDGVRLHSDSVPVKGSSGNGGLRMAADFDIENGSAHGDGSMMIDPLTVTLGMNGGDNGGGHLLGAVNCTPSVPSAPALSLFSDAYDVLLDGSSPHVAAEAEARVQVTVRRSQSDRSARCEAAEAEADVAEAEAESLSRSKMRLSGRRGAGGKLLRTRSEPPDLNRLRPRRLKPSAYTGSVRVGNRTPATNNNRYTRNKSRFCSVGNVNDNNKPTSTPSNMFTSTTPTPPRPIMNRPPHERHLAWVTTTNNNNNISRTMVSFLPPYPSSPMDSLSHDEANQVFSDFIHSLRAKLITNTQHS